MGAGAIPLDIEKAFRQRQQSGCRLEIYTAAFGYEGDDKIDVSFNSGNFALTPPRHLIFEYRLGRLSQDEFRASYCRILEESFLQNMYNWNNILDSPRIVLVCSCNAAGPACHRHFLIEFLARFGAVYKGDVKLKKTKAAKVRTSG